MADVEGQSLPAESSMHREPDYKAKGDELENVFSDGVVDADGTQNVADTQRKTSLTSGVERHSSSSSCDMAPPPHVRRRTRSGGLIRDLITSVEEESKEKGREYYEEEMEWVQQPEHPHVKKRHPHGDKKHPHGVAEKITAIYNAVEDNSKQKGLEYFEEENSWPIQ